RCSTLDHLDDVLLVRVHCQHQHFRVQMLGGNFCDSVQPIHIRHRQIHYDDVRREPGNLVDGLVPVSRFSDDFQIRFCVQQGAQAGAQYGMVICQHDPYLLHHTFISSTTVPTAASAVIRVPEPGLDAMWNVPPMSSMRSAMPIRPRPCPSFRSTCAGSKPCPLSVMINRSTSRVCSSVTSTCVAPACLATFDSASCITRWKTMSYSCARRMGSSGATNVTSMPVFCVYCLTYPSSADTKPRSSSAAGRRSS